MIVPVSARRRAVDFRELVASVESLLLEVLAAVQRCARLLEAQLPRLVGDGMELTIGIVQHFLEMASAIVATVL